MSRQAITIQQINGITRLVSDSHITHQDQVSLAKNVATAISGGSAGVSGSGVSFTISVWENFSTKNYYAKPGSNSVIRTSRDLPKISAGPPLPPAVTSLNAISGITSTGTVTSGADIRLGAVCYFSSGVVVSALGRLVVSGNTHSHIVKIFSVATGSDVIGASTTVNTSGVTPGTFAYANLPTPVFVPAGTYYVVSQEASGGDQYFDYVNTVVTATGSIVVGGGVYSTGVNTYVAQSANNKMYPVDIVYNSVNTVYLSASGALGKGDGSSASNAIDASTQSKLDNVYASYILNSGNLTLGATTYFYYAPGLYKTNGRSYQSRYTINSGNYHIGSGIDKTIIQLVGASNLTTDGQIFSRDTYGTSALVNWGIWDMTLDCNASNNPKTMSGGAGGAVSAIGLPGGINITIQRIKVIGWGTSSVGYECFPVSVFGQNTQNGVACSNILIDSCIATNPFMNNKDGASIFCIDGSTAASPPCTVNQTCIVSNNQILDCFPNSGLTFMHSYGAPVAVGNFTRNGDVCYYGEPPAAGEMSSVGTVIIRGNIGIGVNRGTYILFHNSATFPQLVIENEFYQLNGTSNNTAIQFSGQGLASPSGTMGIALIQYNTILVPYGTVSLGIVLSDLSDMNYNGLVLNGNTLQGFKDLAHAYNLNSSKITNSLTFIGDWVL